MPAGARGVGFGPLAGQRSKSSISEGGERADPQKIYLGQLRWLGILCKKNFTHRTSGLLENVSEVRKLIDLQKSLSPANDS